MKDVELNRNKKSHKRTEADGGATHVTSNEGILSQERKKKDDKKQQ